MNYIRHLTALAVLMLMQGCVSMAQYTPMTQEKKEKIETLYVYNLVLQDEVRPAVELSNVSGALGGGLIGAMIDSSVNDGRATDARNLLDKFYMESLDIDYRAVQNSLLTPVLSTQFQISTDGITEQSVILTDKEIEQRVAQLSQNEGFLFLSSHYTFVESFKTLQTSISAYLFLGGNAKPKISKPDFHNTFVYQSPVVGQGGSDSITLWSDANAQRFREHINDSILNTIDALNYELQTISDESCAISATFSFPTQLGVQELSGVLVKESDKGALIRVKGGALYLVSPTRMTTKPNKKCTPEVVSNA